MAEATQTRKPEKREFCEYLIRREITNTFIGRTDLLATFPTKRTPITNVQFTSRNLCLVGGVYLSPESR